MPLNAHTPGEKLASHFLTGKMREDKLVPGHRENLGWPREVSARGQPPQSKQLTAFPAVPPCSPHSSWHDCCLPTVLVPNPSAFSSKPPLFQLVSSCLFSLQLSPSLVPAILHPNPQFKSPPSPSSTPRTRRGACCSPCGI